ncbi:MAG: putative N-acetylmannosamine-6-phosphate 2-epimerase [Armatimonadetes bacterium]|nr:putative N-acetylmannosamine-6-phosphate 2-epimerase [Armatimonadota bacterium]
MTIHDFRAALLQCPLIPSVQADPGTPLDDPATIVRLAQASLVEGVTMIRLQGVGDIKAVKAALTVPVIALIKRHFDTSEVYITPTRKEVEDTIAAGADIIGLDGTPRPRPDGDQLKDLVELIHKSGRLALADIDNLESAKYAEQCGVDILSTTLSGYTLESRKSDLPDLDLVEALVPQTKLPVLAEGRYRHRWQAEAALSRGANGVVVGGAINDPIKQTRMLKPMVAKGRVGAVDLGATNLRFAIFESDGAPRLVEKRSIPLPATAETRIEFIRLSAREFGVDHIGLSCAGTLHPSTGEVWETKPTIGDHQGTRFCQEEIGAKCLALNDGLASAWGVSRHPQYQGRRIAVIAMGSGVGFGYVNEGKLGMGSRGEYPRLNDLYLPNGETVEQAMGGLNVDWESPESRLEIEVALNYCAKAIRELLFPEKIVVCGGAASRPEMTPIFAKLGIERSPYGEDTGLWGAAMLAYSPPEF